jgi:hypothetical protein
MSINLEDRKAKLNEQLEQEAKESGRLAADPERTQKINSKSEVNKHSVDPDINIEDILQNAPEDEKGRKLIPDNIFDQYYKILPEGTRNESKTKQAVNKGYINVLGNDPERDREIRRAGAEALNAKHAQRRTMSETLDILLRQPADADTIAELHLPAGATKQDALLAAMYRQATEGNVKAGQFVRDTIGEQPTAKQDVSVTMTDDDKALLDQVQKRLGITD